MSREEGMDLVSWAETLDLDEGLQFASRRRLRGDKKLQAEAITLSPEARAFLSSMQLQVRTTTRAAANVWSEAYWQLRTCGLKSIIMLLK